MREKITIVVALIIFLPLVLVAFFFKPKPAAAIKVFTPFGGQVLGHIEKAPGCELITAPIKAATFGALDISVEELVVGLPAGGTFGILRIDGFTVPGLTTIYQHGDNYKKVGAWVLGNAIDVCDICGKVEDIPIVKEICELPAVGKIFDLGCGLLGAACPISNLVYQIGSSESPGL